MTYNKDAVDNAVLALLYLTMWGDRYETRAWKGHDWDALGRLHAKGYIADPKGKAKSVALTDEGKAMAKELFYRLFGADGSPPAGQADPSRRRRKAKGKAP